MSISKINFGSIHRVGRRKTADRILSMKKKIGRGHYFMKAELIPCRMEIISKATPHNCVCETQPSFAELCGAALN